jgi:hypothetical protein
MDAASEMVTGVPMMNLPPPEFGNKSTKIPELRQSGSKNIFWGYRKSSGRNHGFFDLPSPTAVAPVGA